MNKAVIAFDSCVPFSSCLDNNHFCLIVFERFITSFSLLCLDV